MRGGLTFGLLIGTFLFRSPLSDAGLLASSALACWALCFKSAAAAFTSRLMSWLVLMLMVGLAEEKGHHGGVHLLKVTERRVLTS